MPKAHLTFVLPGEKEEFETCLKSASLKFAVTDYLEGIRNRLKYEELTDVEAAELGAARELLWQCLEDHDVRGLVG